MIQSVPEIVFIVPYRNRPQHKFFFLNYMTQTILQKYDKRIEIYFSHQHDQRSFNRGAMKNIGFLAVKNKYPNDYKNMTFVFNDVDTIPFANIFEYFTLPGTVKHFYGFTYALGGIVAVNGNDFEKTNGFPNYWGWGMEDTVFQERCQNCGLHIDRSQFYTIGSPEMLQLFDGVERLINPLDMDRSNNDAVSSNGMETIHMLNYKISPGDHSANKLDQVYVVNDVKNIPIYFINVRFFLTNVSFELEKKKMMHYDLRPGANKMAKNYTVASNEFVVKPEMWKNIPTFIPKEKQENLTKQFGKAKTREIVENMYYMSNNRKRPKNNM
jgi:hypothetical protein